MAGQTAVISVAPGTYAENVALKDLVGGPCVIVGNEAAPENVVISPASGVGFGASGITGTWYLRGMKIEGAGISRSIYANSGVIIFRNMDFGAIGAVVNYYHIFAEGNARIEAQGNYTISGGAGGALAHKRQRNIEGSGESYQSRRIARVHELLHDCVRAKLSVCLLGYN